MEWAVLSECGVAANVDTDAGAFTLYELDALAVKTEHMIRLLLDAAPLLEVVIFDRPLQKFRRYLHMCWLVIRYVAKLNTLRL